jgi:hypothetical protein
MAFSRIIALAGIVIFTIITPLRAVPSEIAPLTVSGEIESFCTSPDGKLVALSVAHNQGDASKESLMLYQRSTGNFIATLDNYSFRAGCWSPDSQWLAFSGESTELIFLSTKGEVRHFKTTIDWSRLIWDPASRETVIYMQPYGTDEVFSLSLRDGREKVILRKKGVVSLYVSEGKVFFVNEIPFPGKPFQEDLEARELTSRKRVLYLPLYRNMFDTRGLEISPDGQYFFFGATSSASTLHVVARVADAPVVFDKPYISIFYQYGIEEGYGIIWPRHEAGREYSNAAILEPGNEPSYYLDLDSGNRRKMAFEPYTRSDGRLFLTPEGLKELMPTSEMRLLIRHSPLPPAGFP